MPVLLTRVVACEEDVEASNLDEKHGRTQNVAGGIWRYSDRGYGVCRMVVDCFDLRKRVQVVLFAIYKLRCWI